MCASDEFRTVEELHNDHLLAHLENGDIDVGLFTSLRRSRAVTAALPGNSQPLNQDDIQKILWAEGFSKFFPAFKVVEDQLCPYHPENVLPDDRLAFDTLKAAQEQLFNDARDVLIDQISTGSDQARRLQSARDMLIPAMVNPSNITTLLPPQPAVDLTQPAVEPVTPLGVEHMQPMFRGYRVSRSTTELPPFDQYDQSLMFGMDLSQSDDLAQSSAYMGAVEASPSENWFLGDVPSNVEPQTYSVSELPSYPAQMWTEHVIDEQAYDWWDAASFTNINDPIGMATYQPADVLSTILLSDGHLVPEIPHGDESGRTDKDNSLLESTQNDMTALSNVRDTDRSITGEKRKHDAFSGDHNNVDLATADLYHMQTPPSSSRATQQSHQGPIQVHGQSSQALLATSSTASDGRSEPDGVDENAIGQYSPSVDTDKRGSARGPAKASLSSSSTEKRPRYSF